MIQQTDVSFRKYFLMQFTKELMRATISYKDTMLKSSVEVKTPKIEEPLPMPAMRAYEMPPPPQVPVRTIKKIVSQKVHNDMQRVEQLKKEEEQRYAAPFRPSIMKSSTMNEFPMTGPPAAPREEQPFENFFKPNPMQPPGALNIPNLPLPPTVQYIHPVPGQRQVELGKIEPLVRDPLVKTIECNGPNERVVVTGMMGRKNTNIILTKEEIDSIINAFSTVSRIPAQEGFFKVAVGRLILSAIISKIVSSKFIITKMREPNYFNYPNRAPSPQF